MTRVTRLIAAVCLGVSLPAVAATIVPGNANPNLTGRAAGYLCCSGDSVATEPATLLSGVPFVGGNRLTFSVTGTVSNGPGQATGVSPGIPDGSGLINMTNYGDGLSAPSGVGFNSLLGVFLDANSPTGLTTPAQLDFSSGLGFASLSPGLRQIFFIGDGRTTLNAGPGAGSAQEFIVPTGATRLFFGTGDGFGWFNNSGDFSVTASLGGGTTVIPLPPSALLLIAGLGVFGLSARRRRSA